MNPIDRALLDASCGSELDEFASDLEGLLFDGPNTQDDSEDDDEEPFDPDAEED